MSIEEAREKIAAMLEAIECFDKDGKRERTHDFLSSLDRTLERWEEKGLENASEKQADCIEDIEGELTMLGWM